MLIQNLTTEFKDSNGTLRVVWDMYYADDDRRVGRLGLVRYIIKDESFPLLQPYNAGFSSWLSDRLLAWAAPQDIETLKAKLAF